MLGTRLAPTTPGITMMQACGTSLQAALGSAAKIATGEIDSAIAVGSDTTSDAPIVVSKKLAQRLTKASQQKTFGDKAEAVQGLLAVANWRRCAPPIAEPRTGLSMGQHSELMAQEWDITRATQDQLALESHRKAAKAYDEGFIDDLRRAVRRRVPRQQYPRRRDLEKLATLKPAFEKSERGTLTAANSTPLTDGAAAVLLASEEWATKHGLPVLAYLTYAQVAANDFVAATGC